MNILLTLCLAFPLLAFVGVVIGYCSERTTRRQQSARDVCRAITLRGGVSTPSPWHQPGDVMNAPGVARLPDMVEVLPRSRTPMTESKAEMPAHPYPPAPVPADSPLPQRTSAPVALVECPAPLPIEKPVKPDDSTTSATPKLPMEVAEQPTEAEREIIHRWIADKRSMSATILSVWGIKAGGSKRYVAARDRYKFYLAEVSDA